MTTTLPLARADRRVAGVFFAVSLVAYFLYFARDTLDVHFAPDDMMNIAGYWRMKPLQLLAAQFLPWRGYYRPMGGAFYLPLLEAFGLNPAPYHAIILILLLGTVWLSYRLAMRLGCGEIAAGLAALMISYHAAIANLDYSIAFVYDVLCGFFYVAALLYYTRIRGEGRVPRGREIAAFLGLFLCALNSKEMALTLPALLVAYEWLFERQRSWRAVILAGALDALAVWGKVLGPHALAKDAGYHPVFSQERLLDFQIRSFSELLQSWNWLGWQTIAAIWIVLFYVAWRRDRPVLRFCWMALAIAPLPIEFLPGRGGACLFIPFIGWAIFLAVVLVDVAEAVAGFLARDPVFWRLGRQRLFAMLLMTAAGLWGWRNQQLHADFVKPAMAATGLKTFQVIEQFRALAPRAKPHSRVVFLNDPFVDWDMAFIAELWFRDRTIDIKLHRKTPLSAEELANADYLLDYRDGQLIWVRR